MLTARMVETLTVGFLAANYDEPKPIPDLHREMWKLCCSKHPRVVLAAPRGHAKSTAITHAFTLAMMLSGLKSFCLLVSNTESQAAEFLGSIKDELNENEALAATFGIRKLVKETETNVICQFHNGNKFRILAKGSEQKLRGIKWRNKRPDLIICDDLEDDEQVMSPERREKFRNWFMNALIPAGSGSCWVRVVGTVMHLDSMLNRLLEDPSWKSAVFEAEDGNFGNILWPQQYSEPRLRAIYESYKAQGNTAGYAQEYRNKPVAIEDLFFNADYFYDFERDEDGKWLKPNLEYFAAADFAISEKEKADYTAIVVVGVDPGGVMHVVEVLRGRWDTYGIVDELLATQKRYDVNMWTFESGQISKSIGPYLNDEMRRRNIWINMDTHTPVKSKTARARSIQGRHKAGSIRYDREASWWPAFEAELMMVSDSGPRGRNDDQFDAFAYAGLTVDKFFEAYSAEELEDEEYEEEYESHHSLGRSAVTGY